MKSEQVCTDCKLVLVFRCNFFFFNVDRQGMYSVTVTLREMEVITLF